MKLDGHKLGLAGAAASAIFFTGCSILMHFFPDKMIEMSAAMWHLKSFGPLATEFCMSAQVFVSGLVQVAIYSYIYLYIFAYVYNNMGAVTKSSSKKR